MEDDCFFGVVGVVVEVFDGEEELFVGFVFGVLEVGVGFVDLVEVGVVVELFYYEDDGFGGFVEEFGLVDEVFVWDFVGVDGEMFDEFFDCFGDVVECVGEGFDVFVFKWGDEGFVEFFGDEVGDFFVFVVVLDEVVEVVGVVIGFDVLEVVGEEFGVCVCFFGVGFEEIVEFLVFVEEFLE